MEENELSKRHTILIVDDEPLNVKLLDAKLPKDLYDTKLAYSGEEALRFIDSDCPDLVLLDIMMPDMSGYELTEQLRTRPETANIPVIYVTALNSMDDKLVGLESGADEFLSKPINTAELLVRVNSLLRLKNKQDQLKHNSHSEHMAVKANGIDPNQVSLKTESVILIADDDRKDCELIRAYLNGQPYKFVTVDNGEKAVMRAQHGDIDLILLDILLPDMDGYEVCKRLKQMEHTRNIQIIELTQLTDLDSKIKGLEEGADDFMVKPVHRLELKTRIGMLLKRKAYVDNLRSSYDQAVHSAITDKLTGLYNRAYFDHFLDLEIKRSQRKDHLVSLIMIDIDDFKQYNDILGHLAGDEILKKVASLFKNNLRDTDMGARFGGEEFVFVLPETDQMGAIEIAERLMRIFHDEVLPPELSLSDRKLTVSMGIAGFPQNANSAKDLIAKADNALYRAKKDGKDQYCVFFNECLN